MQNKNKLKMCTHCILDENIPNIQFDDNGVCNYCKYYDNLEKQYPLNEKTKTQLNQLIDDIKTKGRKKNYDCIVGVSVGVDSTYTLYLAKKLGLRPLAVHFDNGWNSEIGGSNVKNLIKKCNVDLYTYTADWEEFKNLQIAFLKASVPDVELLTDKAIVAILYKIAVEKSVKFVITGSNFRTEGIVPRGWTYWDNRYFKSVIKKFGKTRIKSYPIATSLYMFYCKFIKHIQFIPLLNYVNYNKKEVIKKLENELGWCNYGGKHYESIFTRWFQSYYLLEKFGIDKRKVHLSALINSGQITRDKALEEIKKPTNSPEQIKEDSDFVMKKLGLSINEFEKIMKSPPKSFLDYPSYYSIKNRINSLLKIFGINLKERP